MHHSKLVVGHELGSERVNMDWFREVIKLDSDQMSVVTLFNFNFRNLYDAGPLNILLETMFLQNKPISTFPIGATVHLHTDLYPLMTWQERHLVVTLLEACKQDSVIVVNFFKLHVIETVINYYSVDIPHNAQPFSIELGLARPKVYWQADRLRLKNLNSLGEGPVLSIWCKFKLPKNALAKPLGVNIKLYYVF